MERNQDPPEGLKSKSGSSESPTCVQRSSSSQSPNSTNENCQIKKTSPIEIKQPSGSVDKGPDDDPGSPGRPGDFPQGQNIGLVPLDKIIKTANTMSSIMMAHKIALEDDFRLEQNMDINGPLMSISPIIGSTPPKTGAAMGSAGAPSEPTLHSKVKDIVHEAYWDLFREEINSQKGHGSEKKFNLSKQLLSDIRQKIIELLLPQHSRLKQDIEDRLDPKIIDQLCRADSLDLMDYGKYIISLLSKLCAPVRDEKLKELDKTSDLVLLYRGIMELLELMRLDFANFTLNRFKPHIKAHSHEYEREKFNEILKQQQSIGLDGLEYTKIWLDRAVKKFDEIHGLADFINESFSVDHKELNYDIMTSNAGSGSPSPSASTLTKKDKILRSDIITKVLNAGYCELLEWSSDKQKLYPETLLFDEATFKQLGDQYKVLLQTSSILLTTFAFVNRLKLQDDNEFKVVVKSNIITLLTSPYDNPPTGDMSEPSSASSVEDALNFIKLETIATKLVEDIRVRLEATNKSLLETFNSQADLFRRQILDLENPSNRVRELVRRRILEFVETLLALDIKHEQKKFTSKTAPPVNIPLGLNCLADEITMTMAQLVKIIRYNRKVFYQHYQEIIVDLVSKYF